MINTYLKLTLQDKSLLHEIAKLANPEKYFGNEKSQSEIIRVAQEIINLVRATTP